MDPLQTPLPHPSDRAATRRIALGVFVLAAIIRLWFVYNEHEPWKYLAADMAEYVARAEKLAAGTYNAQDAFMPVGYPAFLAGISSFGGGLKIAAGAQAIIGALGCAMCVILAHRASGSLNAAGFAGLIAAAFPPSVFYAGFFLTETLFGALLACALVGLTHPDGPGRVPAVAAGGVFLGAAASMRPNLVLFLLTLPALVVFADRAVRATRLREMTAALFMAAVVLAPACVFTSRIAERVTGPGMNGGVNFFLAQTEYQTVREHTPLGFGVRQMSPSDETAVFVSPASLWDERYFYREALRRIRERPGVILRIPDRIRRGLGIGREPLWPGMSGYDMALRLSVTLLSLGCLVPALARATSDIVRRRTAGWTTGVLWGAIFSLLLTFALYLAEPRMTVPFAAVLLALGADAWCSLARLAGAHIPSMPRRQTQTHPS